MFTKLEWNACESHGCHHHIILFLRQHITISIHIKPSDKEIRKRKACQIGILLTINSRPPCNIAPSVGPPSLSNKAWRSDVNCFVSNHGLCNGSSNGLIEEDDDVEDGIASLSAEARLFVPPIVWVLDDNEE